MKIFTCRRQLMFVVCLLLGCLSMQAADDGLITEQVTSMGFWLVLCQRLSLMIIKT